MAHKAFGQTPDESVSVADPITFDLFDEVGINCRAAVNGKLLLELVGKVDSGNVALQSEGILQVFEVTVQTHDGTDSDKYTGKLPARHSLAERQEAAEDQIIADVDPTSSLGRLTALLDDPDTAIKIDQLAELVGWLVEQYTARPTGNAANSRTGDSSMRGTSRRARRATDRRVAGETATQSTVSP